MIVYTVNPDISCREEGPAGALLFNPDTDHTLVINKTGLLIWYTLTQPQSLEEVVTALQARYRQVPAAQLMADVEEFVGQMQELGFIGVCP